MVIGNQVGKRRELCRMGSGIERGRIEADVCNLIYLKNRIVGIIVPLGQDVWLGATRGVLVERVVCVPGPDLRG